MSKTPPPIPDANTPEEPKTVHQAFYKLRISQLETEVEEYKDFFRLLVKLLDKHGVNPRDFHDEL